MLRPGYMYALRDPERYDDEYGEGFGYVISPPEGLDEAYIADCWIADQKGNIHPGYDACPVPIRFADVIEESAQPWTRPLPTPVSLENSAFFRR